MDSKQADLSGVPYHPDRTALKNAGLPEKTVVNCVQTEAGLNATIRDTFNGGAGYHVLEASEPANGDPSFVRERLSVVANGPDKKVFDVEVGAQSLPGGLAGNGAQAIGQQAYDKGQKIIKACKPGSP